MIAGDLLSGNLAAVAAILTLVAVVVAAVIAFRSRETIKAAQDAANAWKEERDAEKSKADRLEGELIAERGSKRDLEVELAKLHERTDLKPLLDMQRDLHQATVAAFQNLSEQAQERHDAAVLEMHRLEAAVAGQFAQNALLLQTLTEQVKKSSEGALA